MKFRRPALLTLALAVVFATGCTPQSEPASDGNGSGDGDATSGSSPIVIGIATAGSGWMASYDDPAEKAARLAVADINAAGGVNGRELQIKFADTQTDQQIAATAAQQLIADGAEVILASSDFDFGSPSALVAQAEDVVTISVGAASPMFGHKGIGELAFTVGTPTPTVAAAGAEWAFEQGMTRGIAFCDVSIEYSVSLCDGFKDSFQAVGGELVATENFQQEDASIAQQTSRVLNTDADFIYLASYLPGGASAVRQIRAAGIDLPIVSGAAMEGTEWLASVPGLSDFYFTSVRFIHGPGESDEVTGFLDAYESEYGAKPEHSDALVGYVAVQLIAQALEANGGDTSGVALAKALDGLSYAPTVIGTVSFAEGEGFQVEREMSVIGVSDEEMSLVGRITPRHITLP